MTQQSGAPDFENDIRQMILNNVRIGPSDQQSGNGGQNTGVDSRHYPSTRGHGRGRGGHNQHYDAQQAGERGGHNQRRNYHQPSFHRGSGRDFGYQPSRGRGAEWHNHSPQSFDNSGAMQQHQGTQQLLSDGSQTYGIEQRSPTMVDHQNNHYTLPPWHRGRGGQQYAPQHRSMHVQTNGHGSVVAAGSVGAHHHDGYARAQPPPGARLWSSSTPQGGYPKHDAANSYPQNTHSRPETFRGGYDLRRKYLDDIANEVIPAIEMDAEELQSKEAFRRSLEEAFHFVQREAGFPLDAPMSVQDFGSLKSGLATKSSDVDLVIVDESGSTEPAHISMREDGLARRLEKYLLDRGTGARLLTRARVPIIKVCQSPTPELLDALKKAREQWDALPEDEKYCDQSIKKSTVDQAEQTQGASAEPASQCEDSVNKELVPSLERAALSERSQETLRTESEANESQKPPLQAENNQTQKRWLREKRMGPLDFPKQGVGIQCDINFFNPLGLHNTHMLYCYSLCDPRVKPMILFVKAWAKRRKINSSYSGTLSSYGYVLMILHYLMNIVNPPVLPNLQLEAVKAGTPVQTIDGWEVCFWRDAADIQAAARSQKLTRNRESLGALLGGFFQYYSAAMRGNAFHWMKSVISLRTPGGILTKEEKGWTGAKTETVDTKEIRHRYLFAVEDPFELTHNVARTVTHPGIVAIRDEFRRAYRILNAVWNDREHDEGPLMGELVEQVAQEA
ncbi:hypothetical protein ANO11243_021330 [Dothideomycetidae sp. 11243]|nr:hypothetical protein ANO11243_021330 [fungal sp. No.11243]